MVLAQALSAGLCSGPSAWPHWTVWTASLLAPGAPLTASAEDSHGGGMGQRMPDPPQPPWPRTLVHVFPPGLGHGSCPPPVRPRPNHAPLHSLHLQISASWQTFTHPSASWGHCQTRLQIRVGNDLPHQTHPDPAPCSSPRRPEGAACYPLPRAQRVREGVAGRPTLGGKRLSPSHCRLPQKKSKEC